MCLIIHGSSIRESEEDSQEAWDDWHEDGASVPIACLLCPEAIPAAPEKAIFEHLRQHGLDFWSLCEALQLDFYRRVKLANFIRREVAAARCFVCGKQLDGDSAGHYQECLPLCSSKLLKAAFWEQTE